MRTEMTTPTAVVSAIDDMPQLWDGFAKLVRAGLGITAFGAQVMDLPPDYSTKSHDESAGWLVDVPPDLQLSPPQGQLISFVSSVSLPHTMCGAITIVSAVAPARKAAALAVSK